MKAWGMAAALLFGWTMVVGAAPVQFERIPSEASWVVHFDADAMRSSSVAQKFRDEFLRQTPGTEKCIEKIHREWGLDPRKDLHSLTAYGPKFGRHEMVLIVASQVDKDVMLRKAKKAPDHQTVKHGDYEIHTWIDAKGTKHAHQSAGVFYKPDVMVFATGLDPLTKALDVLDGKAANIASAKSPLNEKVRGGTIVLARADGIEPAACPHSPEECLHKAPFLEVVKQFSYAAGQDGDKWFGRLEVATDSKESAAQLRDIIEGVRAMVALRFHDQPEVGKLLSQADIKVRRATLRGEFSAKAEDVGAVAPALCKVLSEHMQRHAAMVAYRHEHKTEKHAAQEQEKSERQKAREARREKRQRESSSSRN